MSELPYPAEFILRRAVTHPEGWKLKEPRWVAIQRLFHFGATTSAEICEHFGFNPNQTKPRNK